jgi:dolichol-phosphate mannosyltransferase
VCDPLPYHFEFIFVDDGSTDATEQVLARLHAADARARYLLLSRNFGHQSALSAGLTHASGDAVIMMDGDLQHPPQLIPTLLDRWRAGYDIVSTVRLETEDINLSKRILSEWFYRVFNIVSSVRIEPGNADFRLMSRAAVDALNELPERHRFLRGLIPWLGFPQTQVEFKAPARWAGRSKYTFLRSIWFAIEGITAFNFNPLRIASVLGGLTMVSSLVAGAISLLLYCLGAGPTAAWAALASCPVFVAGSHFLALGILGEYVGRTLEQVKGRPLYIVRGSVGFPFSEPESRAIPAPHLTRAGRRSGSSREVDSTTENRMP